MNKENIEALDLVLQAQERFNAVHPLAGPRWSWYYIELHFLGTGRISISAKDGGRIGAAHTFTKETFTPKNVKTFIDKIENLGYFRKEDA